MTGPLGLERARVDRDRAQARVDARALVLPFGDGFLDDDHPEFHGSTVGVSRHATAAEPLCTACRAWIAELDAAGMIQYPTTETATEPRHKGLNP